jgi:hypothetical protein
MEHANGRCADDGKKQKFLDSDRRSFDFAQDRLSLGMTQESKT